MARRLYHALAALTGILAIAASCTPFKEKRTPSGDFCSDMPVIPAGTTPDREYHRLEPVSSDPKARTEAERLESLRKAACKVGADAVIEAVNEEVRLDNAAYSTVSSGTAVTWVRRVGPDPTPIKPQSPPVASASASASAPPADEPPPTPSAVASAPPAKTAAPTAKPPASAKPPKGAPSAKPPEKRKLPSQQ